ncbi:hypothetical protein VYP57_11435 [Streptococcus agalactiae]|uniref:hypothetical protein n=1 Tax=Streptococcus agalactiae TaxID=1311 RepID=UPI001296DD6A|nr:hypothetical protein [Streptococcus agalactiae]
MQTLRCDPTIVAHLFYRCPNLSRDLHHIFVVRPQRIIAINPTDLARIERATALNK